MLAYEYSGYGQSTGVCNDLNAIFDIQAAYEFLVEQMGFAPTKIILYGYSIGSGPSVTLVITSNYSIGIIPELHSWWFDNPFGTC